MHLDALALACVVHDIRRQAVPARVQQILMPDAQTVAFELYARRTRHWLAMHVTGQDSWLALMPEKPRRGDGPAVSILELLRKYVRRGAISDLVQPDPVERVVQVDIMHAVHGPSRLILELTGRRSNLVLCNAEDRILGLLRTVPPHADRPLRPGETYRVPELRDRLSPLICTPCELEERLAVANTPKGWQALTRVLSGVGPTQAREIVYRLTGDAEAPADSLQGAVAVALLRRLWQPVTTGEWHPSQVEQDGHPVLYAPFGIRHRSGARPVPSLNDILVHKVPPDPYHGVKNALHRQLQKAQAQGERRLQATRRDLPAPDTAARLRLQGQWLLALQHTIVPRQTALTIPDGEDTTIQLRGDLTPVQQAEGLFRRARKLERAAEILPERISRITRDLEYLAQLALDLDMARDRREIEAVHMDLEASNLLRRPGPRRAQAKVPRARGGPRRYETPDGFAILVGRNARENDQVTFRHASARDLWLHVRGQPGAHVIVRTDGRPVPEATVQAAAQLAACHSRRQGENRVPVTVVQKRHVKRLKGGRPGQVVIRRGQGQVRAVDARHPDLRASGT